MPSPRRLIAAVFCALLALAGTGCATKYQQVPDGSSDPSWLRMLEDGRTAESAVRAQIGEPVRTFESGRVLIYRLGLRDSTAGRAYTVVSEWDDTLFNLVLVFDADGTLQRHSLLRVKS